MARSGSGRDVVYSTMMFINIIFMEGKITCQYVAGGGGGGCGGGDGIN